MFLSSVLPSSGLYCVAVAAGRGFRHRFFADLDDAEEYALIQDRKGETVYMAQATYTEEAAEANRANRAGKVKRTDDEWQPVRTKDNTVAMRSFFVDIDCGKGKPYPSQREGAAALKQMVATSKLPMPTVISSGGGLYAYWPMTEDVPVRQWETVARLLKQIFGPCGLDSDPAPTANCAVVLRPPGTTNRKPGRPERTVTILGGGGGVKQFDFKSFAASVGKVAKHLGVKNTVASSPKEKDIWDDFQIYQEIDSFPEEIAAKCAQIRNIKTTLGNVEEPLWYAAIGVLRHTVRELDSGDDVIHAWSKGHPAYTYADTEAKIKQHETSGAGPTTCAYFASVAPSFCVGCPHKDKIKSPIVLGRPAPEPISVDEDLAPEEQELTTPAPFIRAADGLYVQEDDLHFKFYDRDLYPVRIAFDTSLGYEVLTLRHSLPHDGWQEFTLRTALVNDSRGLLTALWDNHVHVVGKKEKNLMCAYIEGYAKHLQRQRAMSHLMNQMGWTTMRNQTAFVLGRKIFFADGTIEEAALAHNIPEAAQAYHSCGDPNEWAKTTTPLGEVGSEGFAFALLAGAFGAPLMKFTGYEGAMVSLVGPSGIGKSLTSYWIQSVYGQHKKLTMLRDDTRNSIVSRLGVYGNLPLTVDEVTNMDPQELSDFVYRITQGRDKSRLNRNSVERNAPNQWNTLAVASSNSSLAEKLTDLKADASAEMNRIFEYNLKAAPALNRATCTDIYRAIENNYGHAGEKYIHQIVQYEDEHRIKLDKIIAYLEEQTQVTSADRFWCAVVAVAIYGGTIAKKIGLIDFDVQRILLWAVKQIKILKGQRADFVDDAVAILGQFIDMHAVNRLLVKVGTNVRIAEMLEAPRGGLTMRQEADTEKLFISRAELRKFLSKRHASYRLISQQLQQMGVLTNPNKRKVLGAGTHLAGAQQECWEIDLSCPSLGLVSAKLVEDAVIADKMKEVATGRQLKAVE